jgi:ABC-type multidrug transport system ATPase subunit
VWSVLVVRECRPNHKSPFHSSTSQHASAIFFFRHSHILVSASPISPVDAITVASLIKQFGRFAALRGVTAEFAPGKFYAIIGDNGAGKTTLLRTLAGLALPTRGTISILGKSPHEACRQIGYMAHPSLLYDEMGGMENLRYFARLYGISGDDRCIEAVRAVGLDPELARPVGQYSQGMRQRMSLARALLHDPQILLLDEPFSNVDLHSAREMAELLRDMRDRGKTVFVVTHQAALLRTVADQFIWMQAGQIVNRTTHFSDLPAAEAQ